MTGLCEQVGQRVVADALAAEEVLPHPKGIPRSVDPPPPHKTTQGPKAECYRKVLGGGCFL